MRWVVRLLGMDFDDEDLLLLLGLLVLVLLMSLSLVLILVFSGPILFSVLISTLRSFSSFGRPSFGMLLARRTSLGSLLIDFGSSDLQALSISKLNLSVMFCSKNESSEESVSASLTAESVSIWSCRNGRNSVFVRSGCRKGVLGVRASILVFGRLVSNLGADGVFASVFTAAGLGITFQILPPIPAYIWAVSA